MRRLFVKLAVVMGAAALSLALSTPAQALVSVCGSASVTVNGESVLNEATCQTLP